jgi:hypothetical protein
LAVFTFSRSWVFHETHAHHWSGHPAFRSPREAFLERFSGLGK